MTRIFIKTLGILTLFIMTALFLLPALSIDANAQVCSVQICKSAEFSGSNEFFFSVLIDDVFEDGFLIQAGECRTVNILQGEDLSVVEEVPNGWELSDIDCTLIGVDFQIAEDRVLLTCLVPTVNGTCTFTNVRTEADIPTLGVWGMIVTAGVLGLIGLSYIIRRKRATAKI